MAYFLFANRPHYLTQALKNIISYFSPIAPIHHPISQELANHHHRLQVLFYIYRFCIDTLPFLDSLWIVSKEARPILMGLQTTETEGL